MSSITWKPGKGKSWRQKRDGDHPNHGKTVPIPARMRKSCGTGMMLIPRPRDVDALMRVPRKGRLITTAQIRVQLAHAAGADATCPMTTGIFIRIAAEAAMEDLADGRKRVTPFWRTVKDNGGLMEKFPGGVNAQAARLRDEGLAIAPGQGNRPPRVVEFEKRLVRM